ncbi:hypothetical protein LC593_36395 [Nostoc sp. CHAB 5844]|nr:hypothetical protein [Brucella anthropi]MCC5641194.1 hypothetical protein [Nostoc sp. CHAB 5844]
MSEKSFERKIEEGFYITAHERDQLAAEKRQLARKLRYTEHLGRLSRLSKQYDVGTVFFAAMGTVMLIMFDGKGPRGEWWFPAIALSMIAFAAGIALRGRGMISRKKAFQDRYSSWHLF